MGGYVAGLCEGRLDCGRVRSSTVRGQVRQWEGT